MIPGHSYLPLTHVQQSSAVTGGPGQFALEQFAIKEAPGAAVFPWQWLATYIIDEQCGVNTSHKESSELHATCIHLFHLTARQINNDSNSALLAGHRQ